MTDKYLTPEQMKELKEEEDIVLQGSKEHLEYLARLLGGGVVVGAFFVACPPIGLYLLYETAIEGGPSRIVKRWIAKDRIVEEEVGPSDTIEKIISNS